MRFDTATATATATAVDDRRPGTRPARPYCSTPKPGCDPGCGPRCGPRFSPPADAVTAKKRADLRASRGARRGGKSALPVFGRVSCLRLAGVERPTAFARRQTRDTLTGWNVPEDSVDDAVLVVSELVTNAERHADGARELRLIVRGRHLIIAVYDGDPRIPAPHPGDEDAESGRGLDIVHDLAQEHGCLVATGHKIMWADVGAPAGSR
jgi:anti-sigma regulatory factor (Ser/Thr protein kinase)